MAELTKKLHLKKNTAEHLAKAYSTTAEAGTEYITNKIDGVTAYVPIGAANDSRATMGRVKKSGGTEKAILTMGKPPYTKKQWTTPGTYTFTVPQGVTTLKCNLVGGGGGGGGGSYRYIRRVIYITSGGGGGSGYAKSNILLAVEPMTTITIIVGAGGAGGAGNTTDNGAKGGNGTNSSVDTVIASGGTGGGGGKGPDGGGDGGSGYANGINGGHTLDDALPRGGSSLYGAGGAGGKIDTDVGSAGSAGGVAAGGGGGGAGMMTAHYGGNGGNGFVIIEYGGDI